jgi:hypothetical protein
MAFTFTPPNITGATPEAQLKSMQSWLFQFGEQLQYAINNLDTSNFSQGGLEEISGAKATLQAKGGNLEEFDALKSLIIKTSDTVHSYFEEVTETLNSDYLAISDFGEYSESNKAEIVKNALGVTQNYSRIEEAFKKLDSVETSFNAYVIKTNAYIRTGYLEQLDTYGVAIGEEKTETIDGVEAVTFNQFATLTSEELAFWQNGVKLGYFKGDSLFVNGAIRIGRWAIDISGGFSIKYV